MKINVSKLRTGYGHYEYSNLAERAVAAIYCASTQKIIESFSHGVDPTHDFIASGKMYEVKIQSGKNLSIEYARFSGEPSGISTSLADSYIMINSGWNNAVGASTGKFRAIKRNVLLAEVYRQLERGVPPTVYAPTGNSPGSRNIEIDPHTIDDGYLGFDVARSSENGDIVYDLSEIIGYKLPMHLSDDSVSRVLQDIMRR